MEYNKIISVTGLPGLFELISSKNDGAIVRSLDDKTTKFVSSRIHNFSHLESIEVYTTDENVNLADVFNAMTASGEKVPDEKDAAGIKKYFENVYPNIDFSRVYNNDMKKMVKWYNILKANDVEIKLTETEETEELSEEPVEAEPVAEKKKEPKAKARKETTSSGEGIVAKKAKAETVAEPKKETAAKPKAAASKKKKEE